MRILLISDALSLPMIFLEALKEKLSCEGSGYSSRFLLSSDKPDIVLVDCEFDWDETKCSMVYANLRRFVPQVPMIWITCAKKDEDFDFMSKWFNVKRFDLVHKDKTVFQELCNLIFQVYYDLEEKYRTMAELYYRDSLNVEIAKITIAKDRKTGKIFVNNQEAEMMYNEIQLRFEVGTERIYILFDQEPDKIPRISPPPLPIKEMYEALK